jgi:hypothetical protein
MTPQPMISQLSITTKRLLQYFLSGFRSSVIAGANLESNHELASWTLANKKFYVGTSICCYGELEWYPRNMIVYGWLSHLARVSASLILVISITSAHCVKVVAAL